jgi:hypothetical protein
MIFQLVSRLSFIAILLQHEGHQMATGPHAAWEYVLAGFSFAIVLWVFYLAIRMTLRPGEEEEDHIKRTILDDHWEPPAKSVDQPSATNRK